jgi:phosphoserine phosphatase RsbU/P
MLGTSFEVLSLLELLNRTVREVGGDDYSMSCFAALIDANGRTVSFANAGHPFPYVVRRPADGGARAELTALVSRGTLLGSKQPYLTASSARLEPDDVLIFYSDSLVDSRSPEREPFGERRLQRLLRTRVRPAGERGARLIMDEANAHYQGEPIVDDITLLVVRLGAGDPAASPVAR